VSPSWSALFDTTTRTWHGLYAEMDKPTDPDEAPEKPTDQGTVVIKPPAPHPLPKNMWDILTTTSTVLLCGAFKPNFTPADFHKAMNNKTLHAVLAPACLR
jgi:hypothetical protein